MTQSRKSSAVEAITGTAIGFLVSMGILALVNVAWGLNLALVDNVLITAIFTAASVARSYLVRRFFNWLQHRAKPALVTEPLPSPEAEKPFNGSTDIEDILNERNSVRPYATHN